MKDIPILFNAPMVSLLLDGSKTQTRRLVKFTKTASIHAHVHHLDKFSTAVFDDGTCVYSPYGKPGDRLWVRETFAHIYRDNSTPDQRRDDDVAYKADHPGLDEYAYGTWKPNIQMPRWASRITLEVTGVRVERLHSISVEDAIAEGCPGGDHGDRYAAVEQYRALWESINGHGSWCSNPLVWAINFKRINT